MSKRRSIRSYNHNIIVIMCISKTQRQKEYARTIVKKESEKEKKMLREAHHIGTIFHPK